MSKESMVEKLSPSDGNGWDKWARYVLLQLESINEDVDKLTTQMTSLHVEIAQLKVKAGIWGLLGGAIPATVAVLIYILTKVE